MVKNTWKQLINSMFMVYKFFIVFFGEYIGKGGEIILFFCIHFVCHETMIKMQGNFIFITTASHYDELNKRYKFSSAQYSVR